MKIDFVKNIVNKIKKAGQTEKPTMYHSYYLFGLSGGSAVWDWVNWKKCAVLLNPIIELASEIPLIKTSQSIPVLSAKGDEYASYDKGSLSFGKMLWNEKNNEKWATKYAHENGWLFFDTEIAFPSRSKCHKENLNPELLITVSNENLTGTTDAKIDQAITIHLNTSLIKPKDLPNLEKNIYEIGALLNWKIAGKIMRPTAYKDELGMGYVNSFWDGAFGVLSGNNDFSDNYKKYGIRRIK